jgi:metal-responsive CopG/Arc/MetJ family transcriptional regulator
MQNKVRTHIYLDKQILETLKKEAQKQDVSVSHLVRKAVRLMIGKEK